MQVTIEERVPKVTEYQLVRSTTSWDPLDNETVAKALANSLFSVCAFAANSIIGTGRIIGDGAAYFYIQDVMVIPDFQRRGVGTLLMKAIEEWLKVNASKNAFIGLMAAAGVKGFYKQFGYLERGSDMPGMYKIIK